MEFDDIDVDSWGKAPADQEPERKQPDRERKLSRKSTRARHITPYKLKEKILELKLNMAGRLTLQGVLKRNKADDVSIPEVILEAIYELIEDGYEI